MPLLSFNINEIDLYHPSQQLHIIYLKKAYHSSNLDHFIVFWWLLNTSVATNMLKNTFMLTCATIFLNMSFSC